MTTSGFKLSSFLKVLEFCSILRTYSCQNGSEADIKPDGQNELNRILLSTYSTGRHGPLSSATVASPLSAAGEAVNISKSDRGSNDSYRLTTQSSVIADNLQVTFMSPTTGYVLNVHRETMHGTVSIDVPRKHSVLLSLSFIRVSDYTVNCLESQLELYIGSLVTYTEWELCDTFVKRPYMDLFDTDRFRLYYRSYHGAFSRKKEFIEFKLLFSFLKDSALPEKLPGGKWNCSVPHWPDFRQHMRCNMLRECEGGEDEVDCGYESEDCGPGLISAAGSCYLYADDVVFSSMSSLEASRECEKRGGYLVSLNTPAEWKIISDLLLKQMIFDTIFIGLRDQSRALPPEYQGVPIWKDGTMAYFRHAQIEEGDYDCVNCGTASYGCGLIRFRYFSEDLGVFVETQDHCSRKFSFVTLLCELHGKADSSRRYGSGESSVAVTLPTAAEIHQVRAPMIECPTGHMTHLFLACDVKSACWGRADGPEYSCNAPLTQLPPLFGCSNGFQFVLYTLVCDFRPDCSDNSDEDFCVFTFCDDIGLFQCGNKQCVPLEKQCDDLIDCNNGVDEKWCDQSESAQVKHQVAVPPSYIYIKDNRIHVDNFFTCEQTEFQCVSMDLCLSYELRCNGIYDCPGREDEADCDTCPGFYRCRDSKVCLHPLSVCDADSRIQCPLGDDEILCDFVCPENCTCYGLAVYCDHRFPVHSVTQLRFLEARGSGLTLADVASNKILIHLGLGSCGLRQLGNSSFPNLHILDVSDNLLTVINANELYPLSNLRVLNLSGNPLTSTFIEQFDKVRSLHRSVEVLDVSRVAFKELDTNTIARFPNLRKLDVSHSSVVKILGQEFHQLTQLTTLDLRQCPLTHFYPGFIRDLTNLQEIYADSYKLCCPEVLPSGFNLINCHAPSDEISSCDSLLRSDAYRLVLSVFAVLALIGNLGSFAYRVIVHKAGSALGFGVFVTHLSVSDFLTGLYLAIIGVADRVYKGSYLWEDVSWRNSTACNVAGFLFLTSSETSTFVLFLVTLDRFLVLNFPCSGFHFHQRSAHLACIVGWLVGAVLSVTPLLPAMTSNWQLYGQNGICIPLPITQEKRFPGQMYSFNVMIVLNFTLFLLILVGQLSVYLKVRARELDDSAASAKSKKQKSTDLDAARRLFSVVMSDFLCWFPVGLLGLRSAAGFPVSGDVNVAMVMLVLPFNSALNPFLYAYNVFRERRRREKEQSVAQIVTLAQRGRSD